MLWVNKGNGNFENLTSLLMPALPSGIRGASFADYDGDSVVDIFLVYKKASRIFPRKKVCFLKSEKQGGGSTWWIF